MQELDLLILGAGWTSTFLIPLLRARHLTFAATTRSGRTVAGAETLKWTFNPDETSTTTAAEKSQFANLPLAKCVLVTFPLTGKGQSQLVVEGYEKVWGGKLEGGRGRFVQLGSSGIWQIEQQGLWTTRKSPYNTENGRAVAEDELLDLGGCVLNLAGLWGGERDPKNWVSRVATTKEGVKAKRSLHMVHGQDVARAIIAVMSDWSAAKSQRWMLTDGFVYDWWALFAGWADAGEGVDREPADQAKWVYELMAEEGVHALPRSMEALGRCYDGREFWERFGIAPLRARI